jgi:hypothetical protein
MQSNATNASTAEIKYLRLGSADTFRIALNVYMSDRFAVMAIS